ncbi:MAG: tRNA preQ1(34) S-adenosylmethionine ribosyltransferase-isomerase QueA [Spirochaetota bacterium]|jgi:S-adenosylmethionine:tRNA ribosyltransferase-isomerase
MDNTLYLLESYDFDLPQDLIAQYPADKRGKSRLFILDRKSNHYVHEKFYNLPQYINHNDILIFNDAKVIPARIFCKRATGATVEIVLTKRLCDTTWEAICNRLKRIKPGEKLYPVKNDKVAIVVVEKSQEGITIRFEPHFDYGMLEAIGEIPLPPYIQRVPDKNDYERYQTVFAKQYGAAAAPTAGLHFTNDLLKQIQAKGATISFLTLYVSWGTFQPVRVEDIRQHTMHTEEYFLPEKTVENIYKAKAKGGRVIAVGTTSLRVLESVYHNGEYKPGYGATNIFIYPLYTVKSVDALITNFHTPKSTLLMLVAAFAGYDCIMEAYREAVKERYRFFSYGDAMFIM